MVLLPWFKGWGAKFCLLYACPSSGLSGRWGKAALHQATILLGKEMGVGSSRKGTSPSKDMEVGRVGKPGLLGRWGWRSVQ